MMAKLSSGIRKTLYVASTYYHVLIACVKQLDMPCDADILCTDDIPGGAALTHRLALSHLFHEALFIGEVEEYTPCSKVDLALNLHRRNIAAIEKSFPPTFQLDHYDEINIFHDDTWMAHYLKSRKLHYRLLEDALDSCKSLSASRFAYMLPQKGLKTWFKRMFHIGYLFFGSDGLADEIEVNEKAGVEFTSDKLVERPRKPLFDALDGEKRELLDQIFATKIPPIPHRRCALLFTQPLYTDGFLDTPEAQSRLYQQMVETYLSGWAVLVKPHPRDETSFAEMIPGATILDKNMPSEMLLAALGRDPSEMIPFPRLLPPRNGALSPSKLGGYIKLNPTE